MILLYIYFKRFSLNLKGLPDGKVVLLIKTEYGFAVYSLKHFHKIFKVSV